MSKIQIQKMLIPQSKWPRKATFIMQPEGITIHNTWNTAPAINEVAYMTRNDQWTSFHYAVDEKGAIQAIPHNRNSWTEGDGTYGKGNRKTISIEICRSKVADKDIHLFMQAEKNAAILTAQLLKQYGWGIDRVYKHQDFMNKYCPHKTLDLGWDRFLKMVEKELKGKDKPQVDYNDYIDQQGTFSLSEVVDVFEFPNRESKKVGQYKVGSNIQIEKMLLGRKYLWGRIRINGKARYVVMAEFTNWQGRYKNHRFYFDNTVQVYSDANKASAPSTLGGRNFEYKKGNDVGYEKLIVGRKYLWNMWTSVETKESRYMSPADIHKWRGTLK